MFYIQTKCAICSQGRIAFCGCRDGIHLGLMCVCCETFYPSPTKIDAHAGQFVPHPALEEGGQPRWAQQGEITLRGWLPDIVGELTDVE